MMEVIVFLAMPIVICTAALMIGERFFYAIMSIAVNIRSVTRGE